ARRAFPTIGRSARTACPPCARLPCRRTISPCDDLPIAAFLPVTAFAGSCAHGSATVILPGAHRQTRAWLVPMHRTEVRATPAAAGDRRCPRSRHTGLRRCQALLPAGG